VKFGFVAKHRGIWPVRWMSGALGVSHGGFYAWLGCPPSDRAVYNAMLERENRSSFLSSDRRPASLVKCAGRRSRLRAAVDRTIDAKPCTAGTPAQPTPAFGYGDTFAGNDSGDHPRQEPPSATPEREMGRGLHLMSGRWRVGCTSPWSSTCSRAGSSAGR
jgi:hypothetical protein